MRSSGTEPCRALRSFSLCLHCGKQSALANLLNWRRSRTKNSAADQAAAGQTAMRTRCDFDLALGQPLGSAHAAPTAWHGARFAFGRHDSAGPFDDCDYDRARSTLGAPSPRQARRRSRGQPPRQPISVSAHCATERGTPRGCCQIASDLALSCNDARPKFRRRAVHLCR